MVTITKHAEDQCNSRGIATPLEVLQAVRQVEGRLPRHVDNIKIVVKRTVFSFLPDGSNGDCVVACVTGTGIIKTVMLERSAQLQSQRRRGTMVIE